MAPRLSHYPALGQFPSSGYRTQKGADRYGYAELPSNYSDMCKKCQNENAGGADGHRQYQKSHGRREE
jgi:hypothetical protein